MLRVERFASWTIGYRSNLGRYLWEADTDVFKELSIDEVFDLRDTFQLRKRAAVTFNPGNSRRCLGRPRVLGDGATAASWADWISLQTELQHGKSRRSGGNVTLVTLEICLGTVLELSLRS